MTDPYQAQSGQNPAQSGQSDPAAPPFPTYQPAPPYQQAAPYQDAPAPPAPPAPDLYDTVPAPPRAPYGQDAYAQQGAPAAPPGAYGVPVGGYQMPMGGYAVPQATPTGSRLIGVLAMIAGLLASLVIPVIGGALAFQIGEQVPVDRVMTEDGDLILAALAPVRDLVLGAEITFWIGTLLGLCAIALGIIAIAKRLGRGLGVTGIVLAVLGSFGFFFVFGLLWGVGSAAGMV